MVLTYISLVINDIDHISIDQMRLIHIVEGNLLHSVYLFSKVNLIQKYPK